MWQDLNSWMALKAPNTQKKYKATLREFLSMQNLELDEAGYKALCETTALDASRYLTWCKSRPAQPGRARLTADTVSLATVKHKGIVMYSIFDELVAQGQVTTNPFAKSKRELRKIQGNDRRPHQLIPFEKVAALFELEWKDAKGRTTKAVLAALFGGALRRSEATALRMMDLKRTPKGNIYLNLRNTKRQKQEAQALPEWAGLILLEHAELRRKEGAKETDPLFCDYVAGKVTNEPIQDRTLARRFTRALGRVGLTGDYSPHCARATAITKLLEDGLTHRSVQKFSRHSTIDMVAHYDKMRDLEGEDVAIQLQFGKKGIGRN